MAGNKYLTVGATTDMDEVASSQTSAGAGDAGKIVALNSAGQIDITMLPDQEAFTMTSSEAISAGAFINIWNSAGSIKVRNADSSTALPAHGFAPSAIGNGSTGTVIISDGASNSSLSGLTLGTQYYLGAVGAVQTTKPSTSGYIVQRLGVAKSTAELEVEYGPVVTRA